jgi:ABC-type lipoprotein export system ATPase subunit
MISLKNISKSYNKDGKIVPVLNNLSLDINQGEWITLLGGSGSGKTTLLFTIAGLLTPESGKLLIDETDIYALSRENRNDFRAKKCGFIFQSFHLFPHLTVLQNVMMSGGQFNTDTKKASDLLERFSLDHRGHHLPSELSVGEKQRCAIARAVYSQPSIILADEPTGNLDPQNSRMVIDDLRKINADKVTILFITHRPPEDISEISTRILTIANGTVGGK